MIFASSGKFSNVTYGIVMYFIWLCADAVAVPEPEVGVETLMARMKSLSERAEEFSPEERTKRFEHVESQSAEELPAQAAVQAAQAQALLKSDISQFVEDATFLYQDFAKRGEISDIPTFRVQVSWSNHTFVHLIGWYFV